MLDISGRAMFQKGLTYDSRIFFVATIKIYFVTSRYAILNNKIHYKFKYLVKFK